MRDSLTRLAVASGILAVFVSVLGVAGCATPYQEQGLMGGYYDYQIDERTYFVSFSGNAYTESPEVYRLALYRVAELGKEKNYSYFTVKNKNSRASRYHAPVGTERIKVKRPITTLVVAYYEENPEVPEEKVYNIETILNKSNYF